MKEALEKADLKVHLMVQPVCYYTPDAGPKGWVNLPEAPFGKSTANDVGNKPGLHNPPLECNFPYVFALTSS